MKTAQVGFVDSTMLTTGLLSAVVLVPFYPLMAAIFSSIT